MLELKSSISLDRQPVKMFKEGLTGSTGIYTRSVLYVFFILFHDYDT